MLVLTNADDLDTLAPPTWATLWRENVHTADAAQIMNCSPQTARERMEQAGRDHDRRERACEAAASLLEYSGAGGRVQVLTSRGRYIGRSKWDELALGLVREAHA